MTLSCPLIVFRRRPKSGRLKLSLILVVFGVVVISYPTILQFILQRITKASVDVSLDAPNVINFVIGLDKAGATKPLQFYYFQYLAIKSAKVYGKPDAVRLHYFHKPVGVWFERSVRHLDDLVKIRNLTTEVFGHKLDHFAHRADFFRLETLNEEGGVFADLDTIVLRPLNELLRHEVAIGKEGSDGKTLLNAFTVAKKSSFFVQRWIESYESYNGSQWNHHSCKVPVMLAKQYPEHITILDHRASAWPMWYHSGIMDAFFFRTYDYATNYVTHLWETTTSRFLKSLTAHKIWRLDTSLFCKLRNLTIDEDGAGNWTETNLARCQTITKEGAKNRRKGLVGLWSLRNLDADTLPRIPDLSGNHMSGLLSPLNGYDLVKESVAVADSKFFAFRGDHIFLPMLPESSSRNYTLKLWFRLQRQPNNETRTFLTLDFVDAPVALNLEIVNNGSSLNLTMENLDKKVLEASETLPMEIEVGKWHSLVIIGNGGYHTLAVKQGWTNKFSVVIMGNELFDRWHRYALRSIWLGRRLVGTPLHYYRTLEHDTDAHFDASDVRLYDWAMTTDDALFMNNSTLNTEL